MTDIERFLISLFLKPRLRNSIVAPGWSDHWASLLGTAPDEVLTNFQRIGLLRHPDISGQLSVKFRVPELADLCRSYDLHPRGKKDELVSRLVDKVETSLLQRHIGTVDALECTELGREIGESFRSEANSKRATAERAVLDALTNRNLLDACKIMFEYEAKQPWPRAIGADWTRPDKSRELALLRELFSQPSVSELELLAAGQALLWGKEPAEFLPKRSGPRRSKTAEERAVEIEARKQATIASQRITLRGYLSNQDILLGVSILAGSCCEHCKSLSGNYTFDEVPQLPHEGCTNPKGCRCCYAPLTSLSFKHLT